ncbi:MAG: electron transfer flavoprotein subunit beta/FixA family protein, partial [Acidimicrobiales bacterium]
LLTAKVLAKAIGREAFDLVICATESSDGYTGTVPTQIAELLGLPSITFAKAVTVDGGTIKVDRQTEAGFDEVTCPTPAVISVTAGVVEPRYPSFKGIMAAKSKPIDTLSVGDIGVTANTDQRVDDVRKAEARGAGELVEDDGQAVDRIVAFLEELKVI